MRSAGAVWSVPIAHFGFVDDDEMILGHVHA